MTHGAIWLLWSLSTRAKDRSTLKNVCFPHCNKHLRDQSFFPYMTPRKQTIKPLLFGWHKKKTCCFTRWYQNKELLTARVFSKGHLQNWLAFNVILSSASLWNLDPDTNLSLLLFKLIQFPVGALSLFLHYSFYNHNSMYRQCIIIFFSYAGIPVQNVVCFICILCRGVVQWQVLTDCCIKFIYKIIICTYITYNTIIL